MFYGGEQYPFAIAMDQVVRIAEGDWHIFPIRLIGSKQFALLIRPGDTFRSRIGRTVVVGKIYRTG